MEHLDLTVPVDTLRTVAPRLVDGFGAEAGLGQDDIDECTEAVLNLLSHEVIGRAAAAPERWTEVPFTYPERGMLVRGIIDLVFPTDETRQSWVVVDWKSHIPPAGDPRRAVYADQLTRYARSLVKALTGVTPNDVETVLAGPPPQTLAEVEDDELSLLHESLQDPVQALVDDGALFPAVGLEIGEPVVAEAELAWESEELRLCLLLDPSNREVREVESGGWTVVEADTDSPSWVIDAMRALRERLDLAQDQEE